MITFNKICADHNLFMIHNELCEDLLADITHYLYNNVEYLATIFNKLVTTTMLEYKNYTATFYITASFPPFMIDYDSLLRSVIQAHNGASSISHEYLGLISSLLSKGSGDTSHEVVAFCNNLIESWLDLSNQDSSISITYIVYILMNLDRNTSNKITSSICRKIFVKVNDLFINNIIPVDQIHRIIQNLFSHINMINSTDLIYLFENYPQIIRISANSARELLEILKQNLLPAIISDATYQQILTSARINLDEIEQNPLHPIAPDNSLLLIDYCIFAMSSADETIRFMCMHPALISQLANMIPTTGALHNAQLELKSVIFEIPNIEYLALEPNDYSIFGNEHGGFLIIHAITYKNSINQQLDNINWSKCFVFENGRYLVSHDLDDMNAVIQRFPLAGVAYETYQGLLTDTTAKISRLLDVTELNTLNSTDDGRIILEKFDYILSHNCLSGDNLNKLTVRDENCIIDFVNNNDILAPYQWILPENTNDDTEELSAQRRDVQLNPAYVVRFELNLGINELNDVEKAKYYLVFAALIFRITSSYGGGTERNSSFELRIYAIAIYNKVLGLDPTSQVIPLERRLQDTYVHRNDNWLNKATKSVINFIGHVNAHDCTALLSESMIPYIKANENPREIWRSLVPYGFYL